MQWRNRRGRGGGAECPLTFSPGNFLLTYHDAYWKKRGEKERENWEEKKENLNLEEVENWKWKWAEVPFLERKGGGGNGEEKKENLKGKRWKIENGRGKSMKKSRGPFSFSFFFFFFFFFFFCLPLFETTEICFGSTKMDNFYQEKAYFKPGKKSRKVTLPPLKNTPLTPLKSCVAYDPDLKVFWSAYFLIIRENKLILLAPNNRICILLKATLETC